MGREGPRALVIAALLAEGKDPAALFTGGYGPPPLSEAEQAAIAAPPQTHRFGCKANFPQWLESELTKRFGGALLEEMAAFAGRAPGGSARQHIKSFARRACWRALSKTASPATPWAHMASAAPR